MLYNEVGHNEIAYSGTRQGQRCEYSSAMDEGMCLAERSALDCELAAANAELAWLDYALTWLSQPSFKAVQIGSAALIV
jgi:hypothetical protein